MLDGASLSDASLLVAGRGMNILTGRSQEEDEAEAAAKAKASAAPRHGGSVGDSHASQETAPAKMVELRYGSYQGLQLSKAEVRKIKAEECRELLARRKLSLVLDLDHTLLNSALYAELDQEQGNLLEAWKAGQGGDSSCTGGPGSDDEKLSPEELERRRQVAAELARGEQAKKELELEIAMREREAEGVHGKPSCQEPDAAAGHATAGSSSGDKPAAGIVDRSAQGEMLFHLRHIGMWTKLRPYVREFLAASSELCELYVYTMGARAYANEMVGLLDPTGALGLRQSDRVIAKEDCTVSHVKDLDVILGSERTTLIIDDTPAVWPQHSTQVLVPKRYHFFPSSSARFKDSAAALVTGEDEDAHSGQLSALLRALKQIHAHYFDDALPSNVEGAANPPHVCDSVRAVRRRVLAWQTLVFSHVIPLEQQKAPQTHAAWRLASELGASIKGSIGPDVTHVVAGRDAHGIVASNTDKVRWALSHATHAVTIDWLTTCGHLWRKAAEHENEVEPTDPARATSRRREKGKNADSSAAPPPAGVN
jgi:hypothetical protein